MNNPYHGGPPPPPPHGNPQFLAQQQPGMHHPGGHQYQPPPGGLPPPPPQSLTFQQIQQSQFDQVAAHYSRHQQVIRDESMHKLKRLDDINANIGRISSSLCSFFDELTKDKQPTAKIKQTRGIFEEFLKHLRKVESDLLNEIANLQLASTGHQHEGSIYGARKDFDLAKMHVSLVVNQISALRDALNSPNLPPPHPEELDTDDDDDDNSKRISSAPPTSNGAASYHDEPASEAMDAGKVNGHSKDNNNEMEVNGTS